MTNQGSQCIKHIKYDTPEGKQQAREFLEKLDSGEFKFKEKFTPIYDNVEKLTFLEHGESFRGLSVLLFT